MDLAAVLTFEILNGVATLVLISVGLAIVFGMMRVINLAHGEFLMLGGYAAIVATNHGVNIWIAMLLVAPIVVGIIGVIAERLIIRVLYGRMIDTLLATWGLSLFFIGLVTTIFGNTVNGIGAPLGGIAVGRYSISLYRLVLGGTAIMAGTASAASLFGTVNQLLTYLTTPVIGEAGLLAAAILLLRVLPHGITGKLFRGSL